MVDHRDAGGSLLPHAHLMTTETLDTGVRPTREAILRSHMDAERRHDIDAKELSLHHGDDIVFVDTLITGTHHGPWAGIPATDRRIEVRCGCIFHFDSYHLMKETVYFDHATLLAQIGVEG
jgi:hypothetical protein